MPDIEFSNVGFSYPLGELDEALEADAGATVGADAGAASVADVGTGACTSVADPSVATPATPVTPVTPVAPARPRVLEGLSFSVESGQLVALVGDNGSGKSTIAKLCAAFAIPDSGEVQVLGKLTGELDGTGIQELRQAVGMVFQNPDEQFVTSTVFDEVAFGPCNMGLSRDEVCERIDKALSAVGMLGHIGSNVNKLSGGQRQRIAIADALAMRPKVLILDEPTSMLDADARLGVMEVVRRLRDNGMTVLLITHSLEEAKMADRVLEVADGKCRELDKASLASLELDFDAIAERVASERAASVASAGATPAASASLGVTPAAYTDADAKPLVRFENVSFVYEAGVGFDLGLAGGKGPGGQGDLPLRRAAVEALSLDVMEGEVLALMGPNGSGKSTVLQLMNGLLRPVSGQVLVRGVPTASRAGANNARSVVGLCFQSPERGFFSQTAFREIAFGPENMGLDSCEVEERCREAMESVGLAFDGYAERSPFELSGGERRRLALASVLAMRPQVLALDEPCSGLDRSSRVALLETLLRLKQRGQAMVVVTHDEREAELLADRVVRLG